MPAQTLDSKCYLVGFLSGPVVLLIIYCQPPTVNRLIFLPAEFRCWGGAGLPVGALIPRGAGRPLPAVRRGSASPGRSARCAGLHPKPVQARSPAWGLSALLWLFPREN